MLIILYIASFTIFLYLLALKWGVFEAMQVSKYRLLNKIGNCTFCTVFWLNVFSFLIVTYTPFASLFSPLIAAFIVCLVLINRIL